MSDISNETKKSSRLSQNKVFVISFRAITLLCAVWGILANTYAFEGGIRPTALLSYTVQSNILVALFIAVLLIRTIVSVCGKTQTQAPDKPYGFYPRLSAFITFAISVTMIVYWTLLAPNANRSWGRLFELRNLAVHLITPLLMIVDYVLFVERGKLKKLDPLLFAVIPYVYLAEAMILGLTRSVRFGNSYFLYFFLDIDQYGALVIVMLAVITLVFMVIAFLWKRIDTKLGQRRKQ